MIKQNDNLIELIPLLLSVIVAVVASLYDLKTQQNAKDPQLVLYKEGSTGIRFSIENERVQSDCCTLIFPPYGNDTVAVFTGGNNSKQVPNTVLLGSFCMTLDMDWFKYFELLISYNDITENELFVFPFCVDMYYHYLDKKFRAIYLVSLDLCLRDREMHIENWNYEKIQTGKVKEEHVSYELDIREFYPIKSWKYKKTINDEK